MLKRKYNIIQCNKSSEGNRCEAIDVASKQRNVALQIECSS